MSGDGAHKTVYIRMCEGLDWKRSFALHLCFGSRLTSPIRDVLQAYMNSLQSDGIAPPPYPPYIEARGGGTTPHTDSLPYDTCYHLLQLYCNRDYSLELTLQPAASIPHLLDYRIRYHLPIADIMSCIESFMFLSI